MTHCHTLIAALRQQGCRLTPQREMIVEALAHGGRHMTAEEVLEVVRQKTSAVNIATVYRTLDLLVEKGLATRTDLGEGHVVYATVRHGPHIHLVCRRCGRVQEADAALLAPLTDALRERYHFCCDTGHLALYGLCEECEKTEHRIRET
ncbi:MAG: transcriptional repressor [Thermoflexia bacterium]|nr:MAG: transcriptional repressor [Thermoflexia bacterium]